MPKNKLTAKQVEHAKPGLHGDGCCLYLRVNKSGTIKQWVFRFTRPGGKIFDADGDEMNRITEMGLGSASDVTLAEARIKRDEARDLLDAGQNPIHVKRGVVQDTTTRKTFANAADELFASKVWVNKRHEAQWHRALNVLAAPLRPMPIEDVDTTAVRNVLKPIWIKTPETASRLRARIEAVLNYGKALGWRSGDNPARWKSHLDQTLSTKKKVVEHHKAMPYQDIPAFIAQLRQRDAMSALALEICILTATRSGEVFGATWSEVDLGAKTWTISVGRMKMKREHKVPLCDRAVEILRQVGEVGLGEYIFPGRDSGPMSDTAFQTLLRRMNVDVTPHGFRSSFCDWANEETDASHEVIEMSLAHAIRSPVEKAYRRKSLFEKRRELMRDWAKFVCGGETDE